MQNNTWSAEIKSILTEHNLAHIFEQQLIFPLKQTIMKLKTFVERRSISKLRLGILPIRLETAKYLRPILPENEHMYLLL